MVWNSFTNLRTNIIKHPNSQSASKIDMELWTTKKTYYNSENETAFEVGCKWEEQNHYKLSYRTQILMEKRRNMKLRSAREKKIATELTKIITKKKRIIKRLIAYRLGLWINFLSYYLVSHFIHGWEPHVILGCSRLLDYGNWILFKWQQNYVTILRKIFEVDFLCVLYTGSIFLSFGFF